jgi:hypothetical protein
VGVGVWLLRWTGGVKSLDEEVAMTLNFKNTGFSGDSRVTLELRAFPHKWHASEDLCHSLKLL